MQENTPLSVTNPFQAASEIFYKPTQVFEAISVKDNWSWIPFVIVTAVAILPLYLYFNLVDFEWYRGIIAKMQLPEGSPAELEAFSNAMDFGTTQMFTLVSIGVGLPIIMAILAGYFTLWTRNDEKSLHGFTDWYGATWWMAMPSVINALFACLYMATVDAGTQLNQAALAPLSLAFVMGTEMTSSWHGLLSSVRIDVIWTILLGAICLNVWTNFSFTKSVIVSAIPNLLIWLVTLIFVLS